jgi:hypothetical protein
MLIIVRNSIHWYHFTFLSHDLESHPAEDIEIGQ